MIGRPIRRSDGRFGKTDGILLFSAPFCRELPQASAGEEEIMRNVSKIEGAAERVCGRDTGDFCSDLHTAFSARL